MVPDEVASPEDARAVASILLAASREGGAVVPVGGATALHVGNRPARYTLAVDTRRISGIVEYNPGDLTVVVRAGTTLAAVQEALAENDQSLALDAPHPDLATIGGILASNSTGPLRLAQGSPRDVVIGTRVALPSGEVARSGGKVVKNVAGYDLSKLFIGSYGTLGVIVEVALRVSPRPRSVGMLFVPATDVGTAFSIAHDPATLGPGVLGVAVVNASLGVRLGFDGAGVVTVVGGSPRAATESMNRITALPTASGMTVLPEAEGHALLAALRDLPGHATARAWSPHQSTLLSVVEPVRGEVLAYPSLGTSYLSIDGWSASEFGEMRARLNAEGGRLTKLRGSDLLAAVPAWDDAGPELELMRRVKRTFDPDNVMSPGRFVGGL
jgi:glycolate oxidase FAD binding subunit